MKEKILQCKQENPSWGYKKIAKYVSCSPNLVKYFVNPKEQRRHRDYQSGHRAKQKRDFKLFYGAKCQLCGYTKSQSALQFHHLNPLNKLSEVMSLLSFGKIENAHREAKKCILVCANCHCEIHDKITNIPEKLVTSVEIASTSYL